MNKICHHGVIRYLQIKGLAPKKIYTDMVAVLRDDAPALSTVKNLGDYSRLGRFSTPSLKKNIDRIYQMVMDDRSSTVNHIANVMIIFRKELQTSPQGTWHVEGFS